MIIPTITMGRHQEEVVIVQLWLWIHRAKLAAQDLFQTLIIHFKLPKRSRILRLTYFELSEMESFSKTQQKVSHS